MQSIAPLYERCQHLTSVRGNEFVFSHEAVEISIIDKNGRVIWMKRRDQELRPIHWEGLDNRGAKVETGSYLCKISYPGQQNYYVPFVFIKR